MNKNLFLLLLILLQGCASKIAVMTLESTIENAAIAAKKAANGASDKLTIEVGVTNGFKGSAAAPIPVVPVGIEASSETTTKLTLQIDLNTYMPPQVPPSSAGGKPKIYMLDTETGEMEDAAP